MDDQGIQAGNDSLARVCVPPSLYTASNLDIALQIHCYVLATAFNVLAVSATFFLYRGLRMKQKPLVLAVNVLLIVMAALRYIYLAVDPYNIQGVFPLWFMQFLEDLAIPCLTSAFALVQYALFQICQLNNPSARSYSPRVVWVIIAFHFAFVIVIDILIVVRVGFCWTLTLCQVATLIWGLLLCLTVAIVALKIVNRNRHINRTLQNQLPPPAPGNASGEARTTSPQNLEIEEGAGRVHNRPKDSMLKFKRVCLSASVTGFLLFVVSLIGLIVIANPYVDMEVGRASWLVYQTVQRLIEITFGGILLYISWQRSTPQNLAGG